MQNDYEKNISTGIDCNYSLNPDTFNYNLSWYNNEVFGDLCILWMNV